jgi:hypothetical protein
MFDSPGIWRLATGRLHRARMAIFVGRAGGKKQLGPGVSGTNPAETVVMGV